MTREQEIREVVSVYAPGSVAAFDAVMPERDWYRAALELIYRQGRGLHVEIARDALNHVEAAA